eukprot:symbB.v1.2.024456.t1/scaffold2319.1/size82456/5
MRGVAVAQDAGCPSKENPPTIERAKEQYGLAHGLDPANVTEDMLVESEEGLEGWACRGLNCNAHGPLGNALYRAFKKNPKAAEAYRWLFDDLKLKFRQSYAMARNFEFVEHKRIHTDAFVRYNSWTDAENYLLVEKLVSKCEEESWREMAEMVDKSATFEMEAYRCQAIRKYAAYYNLPVESVKAEDAAKSPHGIRGWCEMQVTVPGITSSKGSPDGPPKDPKGKAAAKPKTKRGQAGVDGGDATAATAATAEEGDGDDQPEKPKRGQGKRPKTEQTGLQAAENKSKEILAQLHRSQQIMDKIAMHGDSIPSEWKWAKSFLVEYQGLLASFRLQVEHHRQVWNEGFPEAVQGILRDALGSLCRPLLFVRFADGCFGAKGAFYVQCRYGW